MSKRYRYKGRYRGPGYEVISEWYKKNGKYKERKLYVPIWKHRMEQKKLEA